ncbi:MAG: hypothetical protein HY273_01635 [Gammaproteobacteria bacterium]|nr:hypothetical protein [Gammaproteobacteria bacterium]
MITMLTGCGDDVVGSKDVATSDMYADMHVWSFGENIILTTTDLKKGGSSSNTHVVLEGGDRLLVSLNTPLDAAGASGDLFDQVDAATAAHKVMDGGPEVAAGIPFLFSDVWVAVPYRARFDTAKVGDTFIVALERNDYADAPNSTVVLPESFAIVTPASGAEISRATGVVISWSPIQASTSINVKAVVTCSAATVETWSQTITVDTGNATIPATAFTTASGTCDINIVVDRYVQGTVDPNFGQGGGFRAHQSRFVSAKSSP